MSMQVSSIESPLLCIPLLFTFSITCCKCCLQQLLVLPSVSSKCPSHKVLCASLRRQWDLLHPRYSTQVLGDMITHQSSWSLLFVTSPKVLLRDSLHRVWCPSVCFVQCTLKPSKELSRPYMVFCKAFILDVEAH